MLKNKNKKNNLQDPCLNKWWLQAARMKEYKNS